MKVTLFTVVALVCAGIAQAQYEYKATINMNGIKADVTIKQKSKTAGVKVNVQKGLTKKFATVPEAGFAYHIHAAPVGKDAKTGKDDITCMTTGGHHDPSEAAPKAVKKYGAYKCNSLDPKNCEQGDLSGKHGNLAATKDGKIKASYEDPYILFPGKKGNIKGKSIVIHNNGTRVACANLVQVKGPKPVKPTPTPVPVPPPTKAGKGKKGFIPHLLQ
ncbi:MAG: superoxide dismutase [Benniella sp.]|nr:MAG: superoxide dismutase [Benniella sp.]